MYVIVTLFYLFSPLASNVDNSWIHVNKIYSKRANPCYRPYLLSICFQISISEISGKSKNIHSIMMDKGTEVTNDFNFANYPPMERKEEGRQCSSMHCYMFKVV